MSKVKTKEIVVYSVSQDISTKINDFLETLRPETEIIDIKYLSSSHPMNVKKMNENDEEIVEKDFVLVRSALVIYVDLSE